MKNLLLIPTILLVVSCSKFLEPKSQTEYIPRDINSLNELLIGEAYMNPNNQAVPVFSYNEIFSDDWACTVENCSHTDNLAKYPKFKPYFAWHPDMFSIAYNENTYQNVWKFTYKNILGCNSVLDYADDMSGTETERSYVKGQALALRAFYYFQLVNLFGEPYNYNKDALGVPLKLNSNMELSYPARATVKEVYSQIDKDLNDAEQFYLSLPSDKQFVKDGRINLPMIQFMKARVALFKEDYDAVITNSLKVLNDWSLSLFDLNSFTSTSAQPYYLFSSYKNPEAVWLFGNSFDFNRFAIENLYYIPTSTSQVRRMFGASASLLGSFETTDLRKANYILKESTTVSNLTAAGKIPVNTLYTAINTEFGRALRLSEVYLMLAEAYYKKDRPADAVEILENLRMKRYSSSSGTAYQVPAGSRSGEALYSFIKAERRREMCFEGLRWFDLRRWGMESFSRDWKEEGVIVATFTLEKNDPAFTLPIPFDAIEKNPNLVQNKLTTPKY